jgi:hypothetical protein
MKNCKFTDPNNLAVISTRSVVYEQKPILSVFHDSEDGGWQFQHEKEPLKENAIVVGLSEIVGIDKTINELANLPVGWVAWREAIGKPWHREKN